MGIKSSKKQKPWFTHKLKRPTVFQGFWEPRPPQERQDGSTDSWRCIPQSSQQQIWKLEFSVRFVQVLGAILSHLRSHLDTLGEASGPKNLEKTTGSSRFSKNIVFNAFWYLVHHLGPSCWNFAFFQAFGSQRTILPPAIWGQIGVRNRAKWGSRAPKNKKRDLPKNSTFSFSRSNGRQAWLY